MLKWVKLEERFYVSTVPRGGSRMFSLEEGRSQCPCNVICLGQPEFHFRIFKGGEGCARLDPSLVCIYTTYLVSPKHENTPGD
jgi:hypothetical protein